ncbi:PAS domain S-box protein, partial [Thioclava sp. BHET1]
VINTALDAILVFGRDGRVQQSNPAAVRMFGTLTGAGGAVRMADLLLAEEPGQSWPVLLAGRGRLTMRARRGDGTLFPVELAIEEAEASEGRIFVAFLRDISARVAGEAALTEARDRAMAGEKAKAEFLAVMSHEIRTPLNGLIGSLRLMQRTRMSGKQQEYVQNMDVSSRLLLSHVN